MQLIGASYSATINFGMQVDSGAVYFGKSIWSFWDGMMMINFIILLYFRVGR